MLGLVSDTQGQNDGAAQRQAESMPWQSEQLNQPLLDCIHERAAVLDRDGKIVAVNFAWNAFARENGDGLYRRTDIGSNYLDFYDNYPGGNTGDAAVIGAGIRGVLSGLVDHFKIEYPRHSATNGVSWFLLRVSPLPRELGGAIVTHVDITDRKQHDAERTRLLREAQAAQETVEAATRAKDEFIAQVTHNLRSPLNAILGWSKVLRVQSLDEKTVSDALATIQQSAEKQKYLIEELQEISRMINGDLRLDVSTVSLISVVRSALETMRQACNAKNLICDAELAADADMITGDAARLQQAVGNLISNAVKFTPSGGVIKVRLDRIGPCVQITVSDTGKGIQAEHLPYLFTRYWRPENSERCRGGLGLGLSYVRHIAELHGGSVYAESEGENKGAKFILRLPYGNAPLQGRKETESTKTELRQGEPVNSGKDQIEKEDNMAVTPSTLAGLLAVVVDDEQDARELVAAILRQYGAQVLIAASAKDALQLIEDSARMPDLLISDISMPEEDGYSLIRKVRALQPNQGGQIPAIALTAYGRMEDRIRVLSAGFQRHVPKPVEPAELALSAAHLTGREIQQLHV